MHSVISEQINGASVNESNVSKKRQQHALLDLFKPALI